MYLERVSKKQPGMPIGQAGGRGRGGVEEEKLVKSGFLDFMWHFMESNIFYKFYLISISRRLPVFNLKDIETD